MTHNDLEKLARERWQEAHASDPHHALEVAQAVLGRDIWFWDYLTPRQLRQLAAALFPTCLRARGDNREARLTALGFELPSEEQRRVNLAINIAPIVEWPNDD
jgi:hypothetical protein